MSTNENLSFNPLDTDKLCQEDYSLSSCNCCFTPAENNIHSRRCFMTGEYCSKQTIIQRKRQKLHQKKCISAFVVMNFSDMSDVVYKWRIKDYIESLSQYLYLDEKNGRLYCSIAPLKSSKNSTKKTIDKIYPIRSDSDPASNYVICSRICQQIQIADLVIVDVSSQNPNVFYELGMAVALGKLILPICYSESYYKMIYPEKLQKRLDKDEGHHIFKDIEHHIGLSPWRKNLFEYYGILYRKWSPSAIKIDQDNAIPLKACGKTVYIDYDIATSPQYGFSDIKYSRFPYHEKIDLPKDKENDQEYKEKNETLGKTIYNKLAQTYNKASSADNTLIVYTMEHFLNKEQAGRCIVNFYRNITARMQYEQCFCGDRVGVLVQENVIPENDKDTKEQLNLYYNVGEIIHIGVNQATYLASAKRKQTSDIPPLSSNCSTIPSFSYQEKHRIEHYLKTHTTNRGMLAYPNNPVYADRVKNDIDKSILYESEIEKEKRKVKCTCTNTDFFCLYHVMLRTLRNTNQIVVDLSNNCLQSLFWLGAAHGSDIHAVTVLHEETEKERKIITGGIEKKNRNIFDVAGLWTAILHSNDTDGFYRQLALAQAGIENHSSIRLFNEDEENNNNEQNFGKYEKEQIMEAYYLDHFWIPMLRYNKLRIYLSQASTNPPTDMNLANHPTISNIGNNINAILDTFTNQTKINNIDNNLKEYTSKWDFQAVSNLSHDLSERTLIGEYRIISLRDDEYDSDAESVNFISIGEATKPLKLLQNPKAIYSSDKQETFTAISLAQYIYEKHATDEKSLTINERIQTPLTELCPQCVYKGFRHIQGKEIHVTQHPKRICLESINSPYCSGKKLANFPEYKTEDDLKSNPSCQLADKNHIELAQLILWRENAKNSQDRCFFHVALIGSSGPATLALTTLLIGNEQKENAFIGNYRDDINIQSISKFDKPLLCQLQENAREHFISKFEEKLNDILELSANKPEEKSKYKNLIKYTVISYLNTVLYRYFFPFLSEKEINCIYNGLDFFIRSMKADKESPFFISETESSFLTEYELSKITETLKLTLENFRGLEAFYEVTVEHSLEGNHIPSYDNRVVTDINMSSKIALNCLFI